MAPQIVIECKNWRASGVIPVRKGNNGAEGDMNGRRGHQGNIKVEGWNREPISNSKPEGQATHNTYCALRVASPGNISKCKLWPLIIIVLLYISSNFNQI